MPVKKIGKAIKTTFKMAKKNVADRMYIAEMNQSTSNVNRLTNKMSKANKAITGDRSYSNHINKSTIRRGNEQLSNEMKKQAKIKKKYKR